MKETYVIQRPDKSWIMESLSEITFPPSDIPWLKAEKADKTLNKIMAGRPIKEAIDDAKFCGYIMVKAG